MRIYGGHFICGAPYKGRETVFFVFILTGFLNFLNLVINNVHITPVPPSNEKENCTCKIDPFYHIFICAIIAVLHIKI